MSMIWELIFLTYPENLELHTALYTKALVKKGEEGNCVPTNEQIFVLYFASTPWILQKRKAKRLRKEVGEIIVIEVILCVLAVINIIMLACYTYCEYTNYRHLWGKAEPWSEERYQQLKKK